MNILRPIPVQGWARVDPSDYAPSGPIRAGPGQSLPHVNRGEGTQKSKNAQKPQDNGNDHNGIHDRLDGARHRDESVDEPENNTNYDQDHHHLN